MRQLAVRSSTLSAPCDRRRLSLQGHALRATSQSTCGPGSPSACLSNAPGLLSSLILALALAFVPGLALPVAAHAQDTASFSISSPDFRDGGVVTNQQMYNQGRCHGYNRSPALTWHHAPPGTQRFAITLHDPDAPGRGWWHWAVANIPASVHSLPENAAHSGALAALGAVQARNDLDDDGYSGPCAPAGTVHRYVLTVYALKTADLHVEDDRPAAFFEHEITGNALAKASITVTNRPLP